jgi:hypothetical protein
MAAHSWHGFVTRALSSKHGLKTRATKVATFLFILLTARDANATPPAVGVAADGKSVTHLAWDTENDGRMVNLLRAKTAITGGVFIVKPIDDGFDLTITGDASKIIFPFDPRVSAVTILPASIDRQSRFHLPAIVSAPGFGAMLVTTDGGVELTSVLNGSRAGKIVDWVIDLPQGSRRRDSTTLHFRPYFVPSPKGLNDDARWKLARRAWLNQFQVSAKWGDPGHPVSAPAGVLANNVISDPVSCCLFMYADAAFFTPDLAPGISAMRYVGHTLDWWLNDRMLPSGVIPGYWNHTNFLDANPSVLISAWDYAEATGDRKWLADRIDKLEQAAGHMISRDIDGDGLLEATQSGNPGTLIEPARSCSAYDAINCGHKDAYSNALAYRAFRCLADLEAQLGRVEQQKRYKDFAAKLKTAFRKELINPQTGWVAWWRDKNGVLHDLASPHVNGLAITYGLIEPEQGREMLRKLYAKMVDAKFTRRDLGTPCTLVPVARADYLLPAAPGLGTKEDGSDAFGQYPNGGVLPGDSLRFMTAGYVTGEQAMADAFIDAMLARIPKGDLPTGGFATSIVDVYPAGGEFFTWDGKPCGYEGLLSHGYHFLQAVPLRDPALREKLHRPLKD